MKIFRTLLSLFCCAVFFTASAKTQEDWPKTITGSDGSIIKIYEPQPESFQGNILKARSAISILENGKPDPTFGTFWEIATVETDRDNRRLSIQSVKVPNIKFPGEVDANKIGYLKTTLESQIPTLGIDFSLDQVLSSLDMNQEEKKLSKNLNNNAPKVFYSNKSSLLVVIDGQPKLQHNNDWNMDVVVNTPFTIVKNNDGNYYLYGGKHWYTAQAATGPYTYADNVPPSFEKIENAVNSANSDPGYSDSVAAQSNVISDIIVSNTPAELIQTDGEPNFAPVQGTNLMYASNSSNDIFMDQSTQQYYVLLSGRWYKSSHLNGNWEYIAANSLPADFAKIPEGSPKDNVLASVAGTDAAREAVMDAQIPQTAKVDRRTATANINYDGDPKFENIQGTNMQYAVNTQGSVIKYNGRYYSVDNGVWFEANSPQGPWVVCTDRPDEVEAIPPSYPVYNMKYVYIYDVTPDWAYMGYTPGYLNTYIYGPTVVYGTGYYYQPWYGNYYFPRPCTWGFNMHYNPWLGWSLGFGYSYGWFNVGFGASIWGGWRGGWWGPSVYHPAYGWGGGLSRYGYGGGYYGNRVSINRNVNIRNNRYTNNIYNNRAGVAINNRPTNNNFSRGTFNNNRANAGNNNAVSGNRFNNVNNNSGNGLRPGQNNQPARPNITTDRQGNVFQRSNQGQWQQRQQRQWQPVNNTQQVQNLNRQQQMQNRGQVRTQNFQQSRGNSGGGGGSRPSNSGSSRPARRG
jgi:hypothetical protein